MMICRHILMLLSLDHMIGFNIFTQPLVIPGKGIPRTPTTGSNETRPNILNVIMRSTNNQSKNISSESILSHYELQDNSSSPTSAPLPINYDKIRLVKFILLIILAF